MKKRHRNITRFPGAGSALWTALVALILTADSAARAGEISEVDPAWVVDCALAHSQRVKLAEQELAAREAGLRQDNAAILPAMEVDVRAGRYEGLQDGQLGPNVTFPAIEDRYGASVGLLQPLYTGGRLSGMRGVGESRRNSAMLSRELQRTVAEHEALIAYWTWAKAWHSRTATTSAVRRMEAHFADVQHFYEAGMTTSNDVLAAQVQLEEARLRNEDAGRLERLGIVTLERITGEALPAGAQPQSPSAGREPPETEVELVNSALAQRLELGILGSDQQAAEKMAGVQRSGYLPQCTLSVRYETARPNLLNIPPEDEWQEDFFAGVVLTWNVLDWGLTRARVAEAKARLEQARLQYEQKQEDVTLEARRACINAESVRRRLEVALLAERSARLNVKTARDQWKEKRVQHSEVLEAESRLAAAQYEVATSAADVALAEEELRWVRGGANGSRGNKTAH